MLGDVFALQVEPNAVRDARVWMAPLISGYVGSALWHLEPVADAALGPFRLRNHSFPNGVFQSSFTLSSAPAEGESWWLELANSEQELYALRPESEMDSSLDIGRIAPYPLLLSKRERVATQLWRITPYEYCDEPEPESASGNAQTADAAAN